MAKPSRRLFHATTNELSSTDAVHAPDVQLKDLSKDQKETFDGILNWTEKLSSSKPLLTFGGFAGTGKTTLLGVLAETLGQRQKNIAFCSFTGKATSGLKRKMYSRMYSHSVTTIHSLIYKPITRDGKIEGWAKRSKDEFGDCDFIVVDEASMVDQKMCDDLMSYGVPMLAVGDPAQLPPISGNGPLCKAPDFLLSKIHRQAEGNRIIQLSKYVRENGCLPDNIEECEEIQYASSPELKDKWLKSAKDVGQDDIAVLTYTNAARCSINKAIRAWKGLPESVAVDDSVIVLRNHKNTVFNGMRGCVTKVGRKDRSWQVLDVNFPYESLHIEAEVLTDQFHRPVTHNDLDILRTFDGIYGWEDTGLLMDYGYCLTVHKAQGSEAKHVYLFTDIPRFVDKETKSKWTYTALTRASERLYIL